MSDHLPPESGRQPGPDEPCDQLRTVVAAARAVSLCRSTMYVLMDRGDLPYVRIGRARRIRVRDLNRLVENHRVAR
ncbi:MAG: helix-turn-helix domain-containing protein [Fimbriiglobus sp.]